MTVSIKSLERRRLLVDISTMLQFWIFLIALIGLVIELIKLSQKINLGYRLFNGLTKAQVLPALVSFLCQLQYILFDAICKRNSVSI
ncbi:hypothetical protein J4714_11965 [Staphylococcus epidermidis]|nr:hypothetical protein [Staphylococcus epidermidis]